MLLPIVSPNGDRVVDHRLLLGVASSSDRSWLHRVRGVTGEAEVERGSEPAPEEIEEQGRGDQNFFFPLFSLLSYFAFSGGFGEKEMLGHPHYDDLTVRG